MAICTGRNYTTEIPKTECIGNSLGTINSNFENLDNKVCEIFNIAVDPLQAIEFSSNFTIVNEYHDKTIVVNSTDSVNDPVTITLPKGLDPGTQVSFIRNDETIEGTKDVVFAADAGVEVRSTPDNNFVRFAFPNSVATAYYWKNNGTKDIWFVFGDLIP